MHVDRLNVREELRSLSYGEENYDSEKYESVTSFFNENLNIKMFNIYTTLGTGTFGRVRQVKFKEGGNKKVYALKMLKKTEIVKLKQVDHIKSEKNILMKINHPFIVSL